MTPRMTSTEVLISQGWRLAFGCLCVWLGACAWLVNVEYGDGYSTVANAEYLLGSSDAWFWQRGPVMAVLLVPAEWLAQRFHLAPLDVRMHHAAMALLHAGYLFGVWRLLVRSHGVASATLLGWLAAIPTLVFFSYAPFVSHDIAPGLLVFYLLFLVHEDRSSWMDALRFGLVCVALVLVKQSFALAPVAVLLARFCALLSLHRLDRRQWLAALRFATATLIAGVCCWLVYGWLSAGRFPDLALWQRPWAMIDRIGNNYRGLRELDELFDPWLYLRNLHAYGVVAAALAMPALILAWCSADLWRRQLAIAWLLLLLAMVWTPFKEVRYLAVLAPMTACLLVPLLASILRRGKAWATLLVLAISIDLTRCVPEAMRIGDPWYRDEIRVFFEPLADDANGTAPIFFGVGWLNFLSPEREAFRADPFHRITEMQIDQLRVLFDLPRERVFRIRWEKLSSALLPGSAFLLQNQMLSRTPVVSSDSRAGLAANFEQVYARAVDVRFEWTGTHYLARDAGASPLLLVRGGESDTEVVRVPAGVIDAATLRRFGTFDGTPAYVQLRALRVLRDCNIDGCRRSD